MTLMFDGHASAKEQKVGWGKLRGPGMPNGVQRSEGRVTWDSRPRQWGACTASVLAAGNLAWSRGRFSSSWVFC